MKTGETYEHKLTKNRYVILEIKGDVITLKSEKGVTTSTASERFEKYFKKVGNSFRFNTDKGFGKAK